MLNTMGPECVQKVDTQACTLTRLEASSLKYNTKALTYRCR